MPVVARVEPVFFELSAQPPVDSVHVSITTKGRGCQGKLPEIEAAESEPAAPAGQLPVRVGGFGERGAGAKADRLRRCLSPRPGAG